MRFLMDTNMVLSIDGFGQTLLSGLRPWVRGEQGDKIYLSAKGIEEKSVQFSDESGKITFGLTLDERDNVGSLRFEISYHPDLGNTRGQNHLDIESAAGVDIADMPCSDHFMANHIKYTFWCRVKMGSKLKDLPKETQAVLAGTESGYLYLLTTCDDDYKSNLKAEEDGGTLFIYSHYPQNDVSMTALVFGFSEDPYVLPSITTAYGLEKMHKSGGLRETRKYPELMEYLGWCSWDAFHMDVTHEDLLKKAAEFKEKEIPVRWMLIDDMWAECHNNNRETMGSREMYRIEGDPDRFPEGLQGCIRDLKKDYGMKVGIWYPTNGYWNGIDPTGPIAAEHDDLLTVAPNSRLVPSLKEKQSESYFDLFAATFKSYGADFLKVDNQGFLFEHYKGLMPIGKAAKNMQRAIDLSVEKYFGGTLINCMGMPHECFWNRPMSVVNRISGDFQPEDRKWFIQHLIQCSFNAMVQGSLYVGDWDMWWSDDAQGTKNAVLRAMSGGPVYMSDELNRSIKKTIMPIIYADGRIIRLPESARPAKSCLLTDSEHNGNIYKVFNRAGDVGILAAFNLDENEKPVCGTVGAEDIYEYSAEKTLLVDYFGETAQVLNGNESVSVTLNNYDDFRLFYLIPLKSGVTPIGLIDKYVAPATFGRTENGVVVHEGGKFRFYSENADVCVTADGKKLSVVAKGNNLYDVELPQGNDIVICFE
ncbi:MAG: hypothetical protein MJ132_08530 [Clostridia bacterium]|nr:hypothetical protein [Clostridia bacterium]